MIGKGCLAAAVLVGMGLSGHPAAADTSVKAGFLTCDVASGWSFLCSDRRVTSSAPIQMVKAG